MKKYLLSLGLALSVMAASPVVTTILSSPAAASEIKVVVNRIPVTSYDIQRRAAFMRLQNRNGSAEEDMIEQALQMSEARRINAIVNDNQVDDAYARFASSNKMSVKQLDDIMNQSGVTKAHFKDFIRAQMSWSNALNARQRQQAGGAMSEQDVVKRMLQQGGSKPTATEYMLQQVIFVVPASERGNIAKRKREAEALRARFSGCGTTREFAKGLLDVTVRDLGRKFGPELPPDWAEQIKAAKVGGATAVRETERGVEFIGICSSREVSDDRVAQMVFKMEGVQSGDHEMDQTSKTYLAELKAKAKIVRR